MLDKKKLTDLADNADVVMDIIKANYTLTLVLSIVIRLIRILREETK